MTVLVIGSSSFLVQTLRQRPEAQSFIYCEFNEIGDEALWNSGIETVINFACDPVVFQGGYSDFDRMCALKAQRIGAHYIMISSRAAYGITDSFMSFSENSDWLEAVSPYGLGKRLIEKKLSESINKLTILRPSNIFGYEYSRDMPRRTFFGFMMKSLKERGVLTFDIAPNVQKDFLDVSSFVECVLKILQQPKGGIYNVGSGVSLTVSDVADALIQGFGRGKIEYKEALKTQDSFCLDMSKAKEEYGFDTMCKDDILEHIESLGQQLQADNR